MYLELFCLYLIIKVKSSGISSEVFVGVEQSDIVLNHSAIQSLSIDSYTDC